MNSLNLTDIDKLVSIRGMVTRTSSVIPDLKGGEKKKKIVYRRVNQITAYFSCTVCKEGVVVPVDFSGKFMEPKGCSGPTCSAKDTMQMLHNRCLFWDKQWVKLQETPEAIPEVKKNKYFF